MSNAIRSLKRDESSKLFSNKKKKKAPQKLSTQHGKHRHVSKNTFTPSDLPRTLSSFPPKKVLVMAPQLWWKKAVLKILSWLRSLWK